MRSPVGAMKDRGSSTVKRLPHYYDRNWLRIRKIEAFTVFLELPTAVTRRDRYFTRMEPPLAGSVPGLRLSRACWSFLLKLAAPVGRRCI